jgi:hypothetical protein
VALRHALSVLTSLTMGPLDKKLRMTKLILDTPALLARLLERQSHWQDEMTAILAARTGLDPNTDLRPTVAAGVALTAFNTALRHWADSDGATDMGELVDRAFSVIAPALDFSIDAN